MICKVNLKRNLIASALLTVLFTSVTPVLTAEDGMTDVEKAAERQRKEEQIRQLKEQARAQQGKDVEQDRNSTKSYKLPQRRDDKEALKESEIGNRDLNSTDLKEKIEEDKRYRYSGLSDKNSVSVNNRLKSKKSGGVVGNTSLNRTQTKKVRKTSDKYKLGVQR